MPYMYDQTTFLLGSARDISHINSKLLLFPFWPWKAQQKYKPTVIADMSVMGARKQKTGILSVRVR